jgi:hypothetical protein
LKLARVNLESCVWGDGRFPHLERLLGYPPCRGHLAIARMAMIWGWQVEHYTPEAPCFHVPEEVIEMALEVEGPRAIAALVRANLAEETPDGIRMKGSSHEATGWLWRIRQRSHAGVEAKQQKATAKRKARDTSPPQVDPGFTVGEPQQNPLSSLLSDLPDLSLSGGAQGPAGPSAGVTEPDEPLTRATSRPVGRTLAERACDRLNARRRELDPTAEPVDPFSDPENARALFEHLRRIPEADRERKLDLALDVMLATGESEGKPVGFYRLGMLAGPRSFPQWVAGSVESIRRADEERANRGRAAPPGRAPPQARGSSAGRALVARLEAEERARSQEPEP